jgi:uncharacterized membrane protein YgcG
MESVRQTSAAQISSNSIKPLALPSLKTFRISGLSTEQLLSVLAIVPTSISSLIIDDVGLVPAYTKKNVPKLFVSTLSRFQTLSELQLTARAEGLIGRGNRSATYLTLLQAFLPTLRTVESLQVVHPFLRFPSSFLATIGATLPKLRSLALLTDDLLYSNLRQLHRNAPNLEKLGVSPFLTNDLFTKPIPSLPGAFPSSPSSSPKSSPRAGTIGLPSNDSPSTISVASLASALPSISPSNPYIFHSLRVFGACTHAIPALRSQTALPLRSVLEDDARFAEHFPLSCQLKDVFPAEDWLEENCPLYTFQSARAEGALEEEDDESDDEELSESEEDEEESNGEESNGEESGEGPVVNGSGSIGGSGSEDEWEDEE